MGLRLIGPMSIWAWSDAQPACLAYHGRTGWQLELGALFRLCSDQSGVACECWFDGVRDGEFVRGQRGSDFEQCKGANGAHIVRANAMGVRHMPAVHDGTWGAGQPAGGFDSGVAGGQRVEGGVGRRGSAECSILQQQRVVGIDERDSVRVEDGVGRIHDVEQRRAIVLRAECVAVGHVDSVRSEPAGGCREPYGVGNIGAEGGKHESSDVDIEGADEHPEAIQCGWDGVNQRDDAWHGDGADGILWGCEDRDDELRAVELGVGHVSSEPALSWGGGEPSCDGDDWPASRERVAGAFGEHGVG
jgi:hypothetical protein